MANNDQFIETFREEALELLEKLENYLLELEQNPSDRETLSAVFRVMHTIKGSAAMFGLERISEFSHEVESILAALRDGKLKLTSELINHTLIARDIIKEMIDSGEPKGGALPPDMVQFLDNFRAVVGFDEEEKAVEIVQKKRPQEDTRPERTWYIRFNPDKDIFLRGTNPFAIVNELAGLGEVTCIPDVDRVPALSAFDPANCMTELNLFITTKADENELRDVFIFVQDFAKISIECLPELPDEEAYTPRKLGEILVSRGMIDSDKVARAVSTQKRLGEILVDEKLVSKTHLKVALEEQKLVQRVQKNKQLAADMSTIRVKSEKLDQLMALVGELVTIHARILQTTKLYNENDEVLSVIEQFGRLTDELRSNTMSIRMVPIGTTFSSFKRLVRDLSAELGKNVNLVTEGGETELDKTVIEKLGDPLVHIIRNSLDHGIELPEVRAERKKPVEGTISLSASQTGASVHIVIEDDGNGLDVEAIRKKALSKGIIKPEDELTEQETFALIFAPGFSTKETVSSVSGRGVGMDVVNRQMELIGGTVSIESKPRQYTRILLKIPLTLAIIDGLLVRIGEDFFVIPLSVVVGCLEYTHEEGKPEKGIVIFHDRQLPFINMHDYFGLRSPRQKIEQMVVVSIKNVQIGVLVDQVVGGNQTVIKPLGKLFRRADGVSSATILGDGSVALILDVEQIVNAAEKIEG